MKETVRVSDGDNTYDIPKSMKEEFDRDCLLIPSMDDEEEYYSFCNKFDEKYGEYQV